MKNKILPTLLLFLIPVQSMASLINIVDGGGDFEGSSPIFLGEITEAGISTISSYQSGRCYEEFSSIDCDFGQSYYHFLDFSLEGNVRINSVTISFWDVSGPEELSNSFYMRDNEPPYQFFFREPTELISPIGEPLVEPYTSDNLLSEILSPSTYQLRIGAGTAAVPGDFRYAYQIEIETIDAPIPAPVWLFGSALLGLVGLKRSR